MANYGIKKIFVTSVTDTNTADVEGLGVIRFENGNVYKWVKFNNGTGNVAAVNGNACYYHGDNGYDDSEVTSDLTDATTLPIVAGTFQSVPADAEYCWILVKGYEIANITLEASNDASPVAIADGMPICAGDADGAFRRYNTVVDADAERLQICGVAVDASAKKILLDCPW